MTLKSKIAFKRGILSDFKEVLSAYRDMFNVEVPTEPLYKSSRIQH